MCIVIDTNTFAMVFNPTNERHAEYAPVKKWIDDGGGFLVFGGTSYKRELSGRALRVIRYMKEEGKVISIIDRVVDKREKEVRSLTKGTNCDDQHIIALLGVSNCPLLCSLDERSFGFIKDRSLYPTGAAKVKIYKSSRNVSLLTRSKPERLKHRS